MMAGEESNNSSTLAAAALSPRAFSSPVASPPWTQIVRGPETDVPSSSSAAADLNHSTSAAESSNDNAGSKKSAWGKNPASDSGGAEVMGAKVWPPLSESTKASPKLSPSNSSKSLLDLGSPLPPQNPTTSNENHNATPSHGRPTRQKSMKRDGGGNTQANGGFSHQHSLNREVLHSSPKTSGSEGSGRDSMPNHSYSDMGTWNPNVDHSHSRNSFKKGNVGPHSRGDWSNQNYGMRHGDQDRGSHDWNHQRNFNARDVVPQPRGGPRGFVRPGPVSVPFAHPNGPAPVPAPAPAPAPMRPSVNPMWVPDMQMYYYSPPYVPSAGHVPPQMFPPIHVSPLHIMIVNQINYYFSNENLIRDSYLRMNMDKEGWVSIGLIAGFNKVMELTYDITLILEVIKAYSGLVEVKGKRVRRRYDYMRWIMAPTEEFKRKQRTQSSNISGLSARIQTVRLDD